MMAIGTHPINPRRILLIKFYPKVYTVISFLMGNISIINFAVVAKVKSPKIQKNYWELKY